MIHLDCWRGPNGWDLVTRMTSAAPCMEAEEYIPLHVASSHSFKSFLWEQKNLQDLE